MWTLISLSVAAYAEPPVLVEPGTLSLTESVAPRLRLDPTEAPARCLVRVAMDERGQPTEVQALGCRTDYAQAAEEAARGFRWTPPRAGGAPARAVTLVPIRFTPKTQVALADPERCVYHMRIARTGSVTVTTPRPTDQCQLWPTGHVNGVVPALGRCEVTVDRNLQRDEGTWTSFDDCGDDAAGHEVIANALRDTLFAFGANETKFIVELPDASGPPPVTALKMDVPTDLKEQQQQRLILDDGAKGDHDALESAEETEVPTVTLPSLPKKD